jgi:hypothetical protein
VPEEPVTFGELEQLVLRLMGNSVEALEQQLLSRLKEQTLVGGKRVARQELPELPKDAVTSVHRVKVSLYGAKPPVWRRLEIPSAVPLSRVHAVLQIAFDWGAPAGGVEGPDPARATPPGPGQRVGWTALVMRVAGTVVPGYLLLLAVVVAYYFGVARVGPGFLEGAVTGTALLLGLAAPVYTALSLLTERRRRSGEAGPSGVDHPPRSNPGS